MNAALLSVRNLETWYGPVCAIRGVSLEVHPGRMVTVLGANGAGKTTLLNTIAGVRGVDKSLVRAALSLGATRRVLFLQVILPGTLPSLFTGFRIALGVSWMSIVAAELIASSSGLGFMISYYRELLRSDLILVGMLSIGVVGFLMDRGLLWLEHRLLPWRVRLEL